jgi:hexulose-6-phosphate isomerase
MKTRLHDRHQPANNGRGNRLSRRQFICQAAVATTALTMTHPFALAADSTAEPASKPRLRKTLKIGMVRVPGSLADKFAAVRKAGFEGIELDAPGFNIPEVKAAIQISGLIVDGTVNANHWNVRHSDPDPAVRAAALESLIEGLRATAAVGGDTILLVPGHGKDGSQAEVFERTLANISKALPVAKEVGVKIAIENVWNHFLYDHEGGNDQTADELARYIDAFDSPLVGVQFDIGNHWKYGDPAAWIRTLGKRIIKLDTKGFSRAQDKFTRISDSDIDWASVRKALEDIDFRGWVAAEVQGGDFDALKEISRELDTTLGTA